jgi:hypothetical protein
MYVLSTEVGDSEATMTVSIADDDHKFDVWAEGDAALVSYQESLTWRGEIKVSDPDEDIYRALMTSEEMTSLLNRWDVSGVRRAAPTP